MMGVNRRKDECYMCIKSSLFVGAASGALIVTLLLMFYIMAQRATQIQQQDYKEIQMDDLCKYAKLAA